MTCGNGQGGFQAHANVGRFRAAMYRTCSIWMKVKKTQEKTGAHSSWSSSIFATTALLLRGSSGKTLRSSTVYQTWPAREPTAHSEYRGGR